MEERSVPYFACELVQGSNRVCVPVPYGALENITRALLSNNPDTILEVHGVGFLKL